MRTPDQERKHENYLKNKERLREKARLAAKARREAEGTGNWIIVFDPDPAIAIKPGTEITQVEKSGGLMCGTFTPGTILEKNNKKYQVHGDVGTHQKLKVIYD